MKRIIGKSLLFIVLLPLVLTYLFTGGLQWIANWIDRHTCGRPWAHWLLDRATSVEARFGL